MPSALSAVVSVIHCDIGKRGHDLSHLVPLPPRPPSTSSLPSPGLQLSVSAFPTTTSTLCSSRARLQLSTTRLFYLSLESEDRTRFLSPALALAAVPDRPPPRRTCTCILHVPLLVRDNREGGGGDCICSAPNAIDPGPAPVFPTPPRRVLSSLSSSRHLCLDSYPPLFPPATPALICLPPPLAS